MPRILFALFLIPLSLTAQDTSRKIEFPDIQDYKTLVCDLHQHTVFSDGSVWPDIRVREAIFDGVDVIALTEHIEYQPHKDDIPHPDRNRSFELALEYAKDKDLLVVHGAEITRSMPPGHSNAIFIEDANKLLVDDPIEAFREAKKQGAFIFWNHPHWVGQEKDGVAKLSEMHKQLISEDLLHGIEVVNETSYSDEALDIANGNDLTIMGTSDIHGLIDWLFDINEGGHRPVTLVFAEARSEESVKEALFAGRTVAWFENNLIGKNDLLVSLIENSISIGSASYPGKQEVAIIELVNKSDATYILENVSDHSLYENTHILTLPAQTSTSLAIKTGAVLEQFELKFKVLNATSEPGVHPTVTIPVKL